MKTGSTSTASDAYINEYPFITFKYDDILFVGNHVIPNMCKHYMSVFGESDYLGATSEDWIFIDLEANKCAKLHGSSSKWEDWDTTLATSAWLAGLHALVGDAAAAYDPSSLNLETFVPFSAITADY